ncbi:MAG: hypothetical protein ABI790_09790 [Betaproteobacteria bacterium]
MNFRKSATIMLLVLGAQIAQAQAPAAPATPAAPETPVAPVAPPAEPLAPKPAVVEGNLVQSQRASSDKGTFVWVCTYRVAGSRRSVQLDESCPSTLPFQLKR